MNMFRSSRHDTTSARARDAVGSGSALVASALSRHAEQTGLLVASGTAPGTFARSLGPRSVLDQGIITGIVTGLTYATTVATQDALAALVTAGASSDPDDVRRRLLRLDLAAVPLGLVLTRALTVRDEESPLRSAVRQAAWRSGVTGLGSALLLTTSWAAERLDDRLGGGSRLARLPLAVPTGILFAAALEWQRRRHLPHEAGPARQQAREGSRLAALASLGTGLGVTGALAVLAVGEERLATAVSGIMVRRLPGSRLLWRLAGHAAVLAGVGTVASALWARAMQRVESGASTLDPFLADAETDRQWVMATCSGSDQSLVSWEALGREGRRHVATMVRPRPMEVRPAGVPDFSIPTVTGHRAAGTPVQVYVSLDSAPTVNERVDLALAEMDRTGAWDRSLLMLVSPTGTGYVNYCSVAAVEYLTRGDVATVTLQYSKRPSPLSVGKIGGAREQNRLLWSRISARVRDMPPEARPRIVLFGESLGAHTSQDVFLHWGTLGLQALGIERALWVGTPYSSGWMQQVTMSERPDTDADIVAVVNDMGQVEAMPPERRARLRYVLVSHDNDGVTKFGTDLLMRAPGWLRGARSPIEVVPPYSPRGVPAGVRWRPVTTFFQVLVDMKNAQTPGAYQASRHDYRPDLPRFVNEVYGLGATEAEVGRVEAALSEREEARERVFGAAFAQSQG